MIVYGIDFTSAPSRRKPITCIESTLDDGLLYVKKLLKITDFDQFEDVLCMDGTWICGIDFPFGQPRKLIQNIGWPLSWEGYVNHISQMEKSEFEDNLKRYREPRPKGDKHHFRITDKKAKSCSPMTLYGIPVGKMFFQGAPRLLKSGASVLPFHSTNTKSTIVEAYPKLVAQKWLGKRSYKSDAKNKQSKDQKIARIELVRGLKSNKLRHHYGFSIELSDELSTVLIGDPTGDNLDALLCAIQAGWSYKQRENAYGIPANCDLLEGWIVDPDLLTNLD